MNPQPSPPKTIYLAGPMQGIPYFNFPRFHAVAKALRSKGHMVFNPAEEDIRRHGGVDISQGNVTGSLAFVKAEHNFSLRMALDEDLHFICTKADTIVMLPGWEKSTGSQPEHRAAVALLTEGMEIVYLTDALCRVMEQLAEFAHAA